MKYCVTLILSSETFKLIKELIFCCIFQYKSEETFSEAKRRLGQNKVDTTEKSRAPIFSLPHVDTFVHTDKLPSQSSIL